MKIEYEQELADLKSGLAQIDLAMNNPKTSRTNYIKAKNSRDIQLARIEFFKRGYNFHKREIASQEKLK